MFTETDHYYTTILWWQLVSSDLYNWAMAYREQVSLNYDKAVFFKADCYACL